jgi:germination protein M
MATGKNRKTGFAVACWVLGLLILCIIFLVKQDDIITNLKSARFFERLWGSTPAFIAGHKEKSDKTDDLKTETADVPQTQNTDNSALAKPAGDTAPVEQKKQEQPVITTPVPQKMTIHLCFVNIDQDGSVSRKIVTRTVSKNTAPLTYAITALLSGPSSVEKDNKCMSLIPSGSRLLSVSVRDGVAYLNFSEDFEINKIGVEGYLGQLMQVVYTATAFQTVSSVQFLIEGQKKEYLGSEGVWIGSPLSPSSF